MTAAKSQAWDAATAEGLAFFWAHMHVGHTVQFVGQSWEDGGFHTDAESNPTRDSRGNTVAKFTVEPLDAANESHRSQVQEWFGE
jgi:hypothetical protein